MHFLWMDRHRKYFSGALSSEEFSNRRVRELSVGASLDRHGQPHTICALPDTSNFTFQTVTGAVHRFEECIAGRVYQIEVAAVAANRWRAYIVRLPGVPTALMPFYGTTPAEAASLLCDWLTRAHARALNASGPV